ncbi:hypothetical protein [Pseudomonas sp. S1_E04]
MKPWISVQNFVLACALIFLIALLKLTSSELASWVQAIGSIAAIWGALHVSNLQHYRQNAAQNAMAINRAKARLAVVKNAAEYGMSTGAFAAKTPPIYVFVSTWKMTLGVTTAAALSSLEALPSHELGTYEMVLACSGILGGLVQMRADVNSLIDKGEVSEESAVLAYEGIQLQGRMIEMYWLQFQDSFSKEISQLELSN